MLKFSREFHLQLQSCTSKEAFRLVVSVDGGSGLDDSVLLHVEDLCRRYEELASYPRSEDVKVSVIMDICPKQLKEHLSFCIVKNNIRGFVQKSSSILNAVGVNRKNNSSLWVLVL